MSSKDKESKTMEKLKQFFGMKKGVPGTMRPRDDFVLSAELEKELSSMSPVSHRIKSVKELMETVVNNRLEDNMVVRLWFLLEDLLEPKVLKEHRHTIFSFFRALIQGQYERLGMMRAKFFMLVKSHSIAEDIGARLELLQSLTDNGRDIKYLEEQVGPFLLDWMPIVIEANKEQDFLNILINVIKYNMAYIDEDVITGLVQSTCVLCCQSCHEEVVVTCLQVLDTVVCYASLPPESLPPFIATLCRTVNIELYCPTSWKIMRNLLGTHLGHSSLYTMCRLLQCETSVNDVGLLRGAVFYINMALWGNKRVSSLKCTPTSVLPSFNMALRCKHSLVMYEVVLSIQRLVNKHGLELLDPAWDIVLVIINTILQHLEENAPSPSLNQVSSHLHETLSTIEQLIELGQFNGCVQTVFEIIERCSPLRPETSVLRLVSFLAAFVVPTRYMWLGKLENLIERYFKQETRPNIRIKVLGILASVIQSNRALYEEEMVKVVLKYLGDIAHEPDIAVRSAAAQLLVDLAQNCEAKHSLLIMDILEKLLNRVFRKEEEIKNEEEAADINMVAIGLVQTFTSSLYRTPPSTAVRAFELITGHLDHHYTAPKLLGQVPSIRSSMLECILRLRADTHYRIGLSGPPARYSMYILVHNAPKANPQIPVMTLPVPLAIKAIIKAIKHEQDRQVMFLVLQELPQLLKNRALLVTKTGSEVDHIANALCAMVTDLLQNNSQEVTKFRTEVISLQSTAQESLKFARQQQELHNSQNASGQEPSKFTRSDLLNHVFPVLASLVSYHAYLEPTLQQRLIKCLEFGLASRSAGQCLLALTTCILEMRDTMVKLLPEVVRNLSKISATVHIATPVLDFLSTLTQLPKVFANFVGDQYMAVFAICLPYTNPFKYNHYTVSLAHHVIAAWFLKCRLPYRREFVKYITTGLKGNILPHEEGQIKTELVNEDSSNRKRSSSLTEQGSRKRTPISTRLDLKHPIDDTLMAFHRELTETCLDLMAMYAFSTCSPLPKRHSTAELLLSGGQSKTWLLGNKLFTVTTSGCSLKALKHGLCDRCYQMCRIQPDPLPSPTGEPGDDKRKMSLTGETLENMTSNTSTASTPDEEKTQPYDTDPSKLEQKLQDTDKPERQICGCWCQGWAEILVRRPTGAMSWIMRLQNEPQCTNLQDLPPNADICSLFIPSLNSSKNSSDDQDLCCADRICSEPMSIPGSPIRRNVHEFDDLDDGNGRSRNPVRRSNSSPEMSASWKNPMMNSNHNNSNDSDPDQNEGKKKQNYSKDLRVNCEAIPEEMGTTPPTTELVHPPVDTQDSKTAQPPSPRLLKKQGEPSNRVVDPSGLPPLAFKRDRGHTISVMSPVRKSLGGRDWDLRPRSPRPKEPHHRSGVNPSFVFLHLYHSAHFGISQEKPLVVSSSQSVQTSLKNLDWIPPYEVHKIGVLYVGPGQAKSEVDILRNQYGSPRYVEFLKRLGTLINLAEANRQHVFLGGLETNGNDGKFAYIWQDDVIQVIFHVATLMPNVPNDPQGTRKKAHIGNNFVTIVYNDSGEEYNFLTVKTQFNYAVVVVEPLEHGCNQVVVKGKEELVQHICHTEYKVVSDQSVAILARQLAMHSNLAAMIASRLNSGSREPYASNWLERLREIKRIHNKLVQEQGSEGASPDSRGSYSHPRHSLRRIWMDEFTGYT